MASGIMWTGALSRCPDLDRHLSDVLGTVQALKPSSKEPRFADTSRRITPALSVCTLKIFNLLHVCMVGMKGGDSERDRHFGIVLTEAHP